MYWFDLRQQFGAPGVVLAAIGAAYVMVRWPRRGLLLLVVYLANLGFAWTYNVGDAYIFFLPSHYVLALFAGAGVGRHSLVARAAISNHALATAVGALCLVYPAWRGYDTFPAVDRSWDNRAVELWIGSPQLAAFTAWIRTGKCKTPSNISWRRASQMFPGSILRSWNGLPTKTEPRASNSSSADNAAAGRNVVVGPGVVSRLKRIDYQGAVKLCRSPRLVRVARAIRCPWHAVCSCRTATGPRYPIDSTALASAWSWVTAGSTPLPELRQFTIVIGRVGTPPTLIKSEDRPYRLQAGLERFEFDVRMESWFPTDTIRRAGFGHVIVGRRHLLTLERGVSFAALGPGGDPIYSSGIFAPIPRYILEMRAQQ